MSNKTLPLSPEPLIRGRVPSRWLLDNIHVISHEDFYDETLTEDELRRKYEQQDGLLE